MRISVFCLTAVVLAHGCLSPEARLDREKQEFLRARLMHPNVSVGIGTKTPVGMDHDNVRIKKDRNSFFNRKFGSPDWKFVSKEIDDATYLEFRRLAFAILRDPRTAVDLGQSSMVTVGVDLLGEEIERHDLKAERCTFSYVAGQDALVDELYCLTTGMLDKHVPRKE